MAHSEMSEYFLKNPDHSLKLREWSDDEIDLDLQESMIDFLSRPSYYDDRDVLFGSQCLNRPSQPTPSSLPLLI